MKYSRTAITQLKRQYRSVLLKCAMLNAMVLAGVSVTLPMNVAYADQPVIPSGTAYNVTNGTSENYSFKTSDGTNTYYYNVNLNGAALSSPTGNVGIHTTATGSNDPITLYLNHDNDTSQLWYTYNTSNTRTHAADEPVTASVISDQINNTVFVSAADQQAVHLGNRETPDDNLSGITLSFDAIDGGFLDMTAYYRSVSLGGISGNQVGDGEYIELFPNTHEDRSVNLGMASGNVIGGDNYSAQVSNENSTINTLATNFVGNKSRYGAVVENRGATINTISGDYLYNRRNSFNLDEYEGGGAISNIDEYNAIIDNSNSLIGSITGNFVGNNMYVDAYTPTPQGNSYGGAIYNGINQSPYGHPGTATINSISGDFISNYAYNMKGKHAAGGAIYNEQNIGNISSDFYSNYAMSGGSATSKGGALFNSGKIDLIQDGLFNSNYAQAKGSAYAYGGAIYNTGTIGNLNEYGYIEGNSIQNTDFIGNYALAKDKNAYGGAIYSTTGLTLSDSSLIGNRAESENGYTYGGAIYMTGGSLNINADTKDVTISGNKAGTGGAIYAANGVQGIFLNATGGDILVENNNSTGLPGGSGYGIYGGTTLFLNTSGNKSITINDNIDISHGDGWGYLNVYAGGGDVNINGTLATGSSAGLVIGSNFADSQGSVNLGVNAANSTHNSLQYSSKAKLSLQNDHAGDNLVIGALGSSGWEPELKLNIDYDATAKSMDKITVNGGSGKITLNAVNVLNDNASFVDGTEATYLDGTARNNVTVISDAITSTIAGTTVYTFTPDSTTHGLLTVTRAESYAGDLINAIQDTETVHPTAYSMQDNFTANRNFGALNTENREQFTIFGNNHTISGDNNTYTGIEVASGQTLNLDNVRFSNVKDYDVQNAGTLNLSGTNTINTITGATGNTYITGGTTTISQNGSATQKVINISDGELIADYGTTITATEGVKLQGGTLKTQNGATVNNIIADENYTGNRLVVLGSGFSSLSGTFKGSNTYRALDYNSDKALILDGVTFDNNAAGAIYHSWSGAVDSSISNSTFTNNSNEYDGGAYYQFSTNGSDHTVSFNNVTFTSNSVTNKGGAILAGLNAVNKLNISNSTFTSNTVTSANGIGSAIYLQGIGRTSDYESAPSSYTIDNSTFTSNGAGGVVYANGGNLTVKDSTFTSNAGDAIVLADNYQYWTIIGGQITAVYSPITANIVAETGNVSITGNSGWGIVGNKNHETESALTLYAKSGNITINGNTAGGINNNGLALTLNADTGHNITIADAVSSTTGMTVNADNNAGTVALNGNLENAGAISVGGGTLELGSTAVTSLANAIETNDGTVKLTGGTLTQNIAGATTITGTVTDNNATLGNITITNTGNFTDNGGTFTTADNAGTFTINGVTLTATGTSIKNTNILNLTGSNTIKTITDAATPTGTTNITGGATWIKGGSVTQNTINLKGGDLVLDLSTSLPLTPGTITANIVGDGTVEKTGIILNSGTINGTISGTFKGNNDTALANFGTVGNITADFVNNTATVLSSNAKGGAIYNEGGTLGTISGNFTGNSATSTSDNAYGGAIYQNGGTLTISGSTFGGSEEGQGNSATSSASGKYGYGGAIYLTNATATITDSNFEKNSAMCGGAIYQNSGSLTLNNATFKNNTGNIGSSIYQKSGTLSITGSTFDNTNSGNLWQESGNLSITGSNFTNTDVTSRLGSNVTIIGSTFDNSPVHFLGKGNETSASNQNTFSIVNSTIQNVTASHSNAYALSVCGGDVTIDGVNIINNTNARGIKSEAAAQYGDFTTRYSKLNIIAQTADVNITGNKEGVHVIGWNNDDHFHTTLSLYAKNHDILISGNTDRGLSYYDQYGSLTLNADTGHNITINDSVSSNVGMTVNDGGTHLGTVALNGALTLGDDTSIQGGTLKLGTGAATSDLNAVTFTNTPTLDLQNSSAQTTTVSSISGNAKLNIDIDFTGTSVIADSINLTTGGQTGVITLNSIAALASDDDIREFSNLAILTGETDGVTLALSTALQADTRFNGAAVETLTWESDYSDTATFANTVFTNTEYSETKQKQLSVVDGTKLSFAETTITAKHETGNTQTQDVLQALNQSTSNERYLNATETNKNYTVGADLGTTGTGRIEVQGVTGSNLNMNSKSGFELSNANTVLYLGQLSISDVKDVEGGLISITGENSYADLSGITIEDTTNSVISNNGTLNSYSTNNLGTGIIGTGTMLVDNGKTTVGSIVQNSVTIDSAWGELEAQNITTANGITNNGKLTLTGTANTNAITGGGKTVIKNALNNTALINQAVEVANTGTLTTTVANLGGTITNAGTLNLSGTLDKAINGDGTTKVDTSLALAEGASVAGTLDANSGLIDMSDDAINNYAIDILKGTGNLALDIDLTQGKADTLTATASQTGALTITGLNISGTLADFTVDVLKGSTSNLTLALSSALQTQYNTATDWADRATSDALTQNAAWTDTFSSKTWQERNTTTMEIVDNAKIKYTKAVEKQNEVTTTGDTLALLNQATQFGAVERKFTTTDATATYDVTADLGTTAAGQLTVKGATDGTNTSTIDLKGKDGFTVGSGATVVLDTVNIIGAKAADGALINNTAGTVALNNVEVGASANDIITNAATMNLTGTNDIQAGISGSGTTNITSGETTVADVAQTTVTVSTGATLNADASKVCAALANDGTMNLSGTTNANNITGSGTTAFSADMNNSAKIEQATVTVASGKTLTNSGTVTVTETLTGDAVANNGTLNLNGSNMALNTAISGSGTTNINGQVTNTNTIANDMAIGSDGSLSTTVAGLGGDVTSNAGSVELTGTGTLDKSIAGATKISGDVTNNGSLQDVTVTGKLTSDADSVSGTVANSGTYTVTGGTIAQDVTGSGSTVIDGDVVNGANIANNVTINSGKNLTSNADSIGGTIANAGEYTVTGGTIASNITGNGTTVIDGTVVNNANISNDVTINSGQALTTAANTIGDVANNGNLNLTGGTLTSTVNGTGMTNINGDVTMDSGAALADTTVASNGSLDIGTNNVTLGNTTIDGTLKLEITDMAKGSDTYTGGHLNVADLNLGSNSKLSMTVAQGLITEKNATTGALDLITASGTTSGNFAEMLSNNRYQVEALKDEDGNYTGKYGIAYTASASDIVDEAAGTQNNKNTGEAWDSAEATSPSAAAVQNVLNDLSQHNAKGYVDALTNLAPTDSMVHVGITQDFNNLIGEQIAARLDTQGLNSGDVFEKRGAWIQTLYNHSKQDSNSKNQGFTGKTAGVAFGMDGQVNDATTVGFGYAFGSTKADSLGRDTDVDGHTIFAYGKYQPSSWFVRGMVNYGFAKYEEKASVGGIINKSKYDVQNYGARAYVGYDLPNGFTPEVGLRLTHIDRDNYTDSVGQHVKTDDVDVLTATLGMNYSTTVTTRDYKWSPKAHVTLTYDLTSDDANAAVNVANSVYDIKGEKLNRFGVEIGVGAETSVGNWDFSAEYDLGTREDYLSHTGMLKAKYNF